ncbi:MAG TPA: hypothetical protein VK638_13280 [Edaphobacter sp.]|nr:hypothetical protein [Edaphobacter sp.]
MLMIYDYRATVLLEDSPQRAESFDHAIVADTSDHRGTVLRQSFECVKGCTLSHTSLLSARALTLREISLIAGTTLKAHPVPGIRLMRRTSHSPACSWTVRPPASSHFARCSKRMART